MAIKINISIKANIPISLKTTAQGKRKRVSTSKTINRMAMIKKWTLKCPASAFPIGSMPHSQGKSFSRVGFLGLTRGLIKKTIEAMKTTKPTMTKTGR